MDTPYVSSFVCSHSHNKMVNASKTRAKRGRESANLEICKVAKLQSCKVDNYCGVAALPYRHQGSKSKDVGFGDAGC
jgi:hypothetical protein